jgi:hypothetical protein
MVSLYEDDNVRSSRGGGYFSGIHSASHLHGPIGPHHRHSSASVYNMATFTASPRGSLDDDEVTRGNCGVVLVNGERPKTMIETSSLRQMTFGPNDRRSDMSLDPL